MRPNSYGAPAQQFPLMSQTSQPLNRPGPPRQRLSAAGEGVFSLALSESQAVFSQKVQKTSQASVFSEKQGVLRLPAFVPLNMTGLHEGHVTVSRAARAESLARSAYCILLCTRRGWENWSIQCRRSNRPGNSQAKGTLLGSTLWRVAFIRPPKG